MYLYALYVACIVLCRRFSCYVPTTFLNFTFPLSLSLSVSLAGLSSNHANHSPFVRWDMRGVAGVVIWGLIVGFVLVCFEKHSLSCDLHK